MRVLTLVVKVADPEQANWIWEGMKQSTPQHGVVIAIVAEGDQVTVPGEIVQALAEGDLSRFAIDELCDKAEKHYHQIWV